MAKTKISEWSTTPASNTDIDGINIAEGCAPSGINDAIRDLMAQVRSWQSGASGDPFNGPMNGTIGATTAYSGAFTTVSATGVITSTLATGTAPLTIASTTKVANLNVDLLDGADWASPAALGSTTPAAVSATTLSASGAVTISGGTANSVCYLNGSKVLTSGSALTFDGANLGVGGTSGGAKLHVITSNPSISTIESSSAVGGYQTFSNSSSAPLYVGFGATLITGLSTSDAALRYSNNLVFGYGASEVMRLTSTSLYTASGINVGIGTSSPQRKLSIANGGPVVEIDPAGISGTDPIYFNYNRSTSTYLTPQYWALAHNWRVSGGTSAMTLDSAGNLALGVTPQTQDATYRAISISSNANYWSLAGHGNGACEGNLLWNAKTSGNETFTYMNTGDAATRFRQSSYFAWYTAASGNAGTAISFTQAMTLDASGNLCVGHTAAGVTNTKSIIADVGGDGYLIVNHTGTSSGSVFEYFGYNGGVIGSITQSGTSAVLYNVTSDQRLKENIVDAPEFGSVIDSIKVRSYDWKTDGTHQRAGFVAQELVTVAPEAVHQPADTEEMMAVDYSKLVPMLVKEIQSLRARVAQLETN